MLVGAGSAVRIQDNRTLTGARRLVKLASQIETTIKAKRPRPAERALAAMD